MNIIAVTSEVSHRDVNLVVGQPRDQLSSTTYNIKKGISRDSYMVYCSHLGTLLA